MEVTTKNSVNNYQKDNEKISKKRLLNNHKKEKDDEIECSGKSKKCKIEENRTDQTNLPCHSLKGNRIEENGTDQICSETNLPCHPLKDNRIEENGTNQIYSETNLPRHSSKQNGIEENQTDQICSETNSIETNYKLLQENRIEENETDSICSETNSSRHLLKQKSILDLSDDILLVLFSHVAHNDLISLAGTCTRLSRIVSDWTLWKHINNITTPISMTRLKYFPSYVHTFTESIQLSFQPEILISGEENTQILKNQNCDKSINLFLYQIVNQCENLHTLKLESITLDAKKCSIYSFPSRLQIFSLKHSQVVNLSPEVSYFYQFDRHFPNIKVLDLSWCNWFTPHSLIALSKSASLEELFLQGCRRLKDCVPYTSLSCRFGFKALKVLDLKYTYISDSELSIIYDLPCLTKLYLAAPTPKRLHEFTISDRSITMLCSSSMSGLEERNVPILVARGPNNAVINLLHRQPVVRNNTKIVQSFQSLVVTGYPNITNITLRHAAECLSGLKYLDIRGTSCTDIAIENFRLARPDVTLLSGPEPDPIPEHLQFDPPSPLQLGPDLNTILERLRTNPLNGGIVVVYRFNENANGNGNNNNNENNDGRVEEIIDEWNNANANNNQQQRNNENQIERIIQNHINERRIIENHIDERIIEIQNNERIIENEIDERIIENEIAERIIENQINQLDSGNNSEEEQQLQNIEDQINERNNQANIDE